MKHTKIYMLLYFVFILSAILPGCKYEPTEVNYHEIDLNKNIKITFGINDSIVTVVEDCYVGVSVDNEKNRIDSVIIILNGKNMSLISENLWVGTRIEPNTFGNGIFDLKIIVFVRSGSGCLLDKLGKEKKRFEYNCKVNIMRKGTISPKIVMMESQNGEGKLIWRKFDVPGFYGYVIGKYIDNYYTPYLSDTIRNIQDTILIDKNIICGNCNYIVSALVRHVDNRLVSFESERYYLKLPGFITIDADDDIEYRIDWKKLLFPSNVSRIEIIDTTGKSEKVVFSGDGKNSTSVKLDYGFTYKKMLFRAFSNDTIFGKMYYDEPFTLRGRDTFPVYPFDKILHSYSSDNTVYYFKSLYMIQIYDLNLERTGNTLYVSYTSNELLSLSENNTYLSYYYPGINSYIYIHKKGTQTYKTFDIKPEQYLGNVTITGIAATNDGTLFVLSQSSLLEKSIILSIEIETKKLLSRDTVPLASSFRVSHDGSMMAVISEFYNYVGFYRSSGNAIALVKTIEGDFNKQCVRFVPNSNKVYIIDNGFISLFESTLYTLVSTFKTEAGKILDIDYTNGYILASNDKKMYIYDPAGSLKKTFFYNCGEIAFLNSTIITSGVLTKIKY